MSLVIRYQFNQPTASLTTDSSGNSNTLVNAGGVVSATDTTYGSVAYFDGGASSYFTLGSVPTEMLGSSPRTFSFWNKRDIGGGNMLEYGDLFDRVRVLGTGTYKYNVFVGANGTGQNYSFETNATISTWNHTVLTYSGTTAVLYSDGVQTTVHTVPTLNTSNDPLYIGNTIALNSALLGSLSDFRVYDDALSAADVATLYSDGPNPPPLSVTMYTHVADLVWSPVSGVISYTITMSTDSGPVVTIATTSELSHSVYGLTPGSLYEFSLYTDVDPVTPVDTLTDSALPVDNTNVNSLMTRLGNDLTLLHPTSISSIQNFIPSVLSTGEVVKTVLGETTYVGNSDTITLSDPNDAVLTPFQSASGSGQSASIVLPDGSTNLVTFDEITNEVIVASTNYSVGEHFVLGGLKASVQEL